MSDFSFVPHIWFMALIGGVGLLASFFTNAFITKEFSYGILVTCFYLFFNYWPHSNYILTEQEYLGKGLYTDAKKKIKKLGDG